MLRYITGIVAVVIAISAAAFTRPKYVEDMYVFQYSGDFSQTSVANLDNWSYVGKNVSLCNNTPNKACKVAVTGLHVDNTSSPSALANVEITASSTEGTEYVTAITGTGDVFSNQSE
jgi:hypothetical protein